jgi:predicted transcriptional regulator
VIAIKTNRPSSNVNGNPKSSMSVKVLTLAWYVSDLTPPQRAVLVALADHADDEGRSIYPSVKKLSVKTSYHKRTVRRALHHLREFDLIVVEEASKRYSPTAYRFDLVLIQTLGSRPDIEVGMEGSDLAESQPNRH